MPISLLVNEFLKSIAWGIGIFVVIEFVKTRDGMLRKIMITYFSVEVFIYFMSGLNSFLEWKNAEMIDRVTLSNILLIPKCVVKVWLLVWLIKNRAKSRKHPKV